MTLFISEFAAMAVSGSGPSRVMQVPQAPALAVTQLSSGASTASMSTINIQAATQLVVFAVAAASGGAGGPDGFFLIGSSTATAPTSTQVECCPSALEVMRGVRPNAKIFAWSS